KDSKVVKMVEAREEQKAFKNEVDLLAPHLDETGEVPVEEEEVYVSPHGFLREMIAGYSKIYGVIRAAKRAVKHYKNQQKDLANRANWDLIRQEAIDRPQKRLVPVYDDQVKTLLTPDYRLAPLNLDDPRVQEGLQGSLLALKQMQTRLNQAGIAFQVVLIPTKELVFKEKALQANQTTDSMLYLFSLEERFWQEVKAYLTQNQIPYVDLLPVLRLQTNAGFQLYPLDWDGHPNPDGYRFMAEYIASQMP
ncbi:MAG: SGNH/GDSL hydrolase family protein, partial [Candidatus Omnitrophica bacterium]|nr:SGNH/GDSL hydrolase family protein [Candidatus Omnitrophota bacterium]